MHSRAVTPPLDYANKLLPLIPKREWKTIYFGGGSPGLCELGPLLEFFKPCRGGEVEREFTVELHPLDVNEELLRKLKDGGVNRISMGVQSLNDAVLKDMGRGYTAAEARKAFEMVARHFDNCGVDFIVGYPGDSVEWWARAGIPAFQDWGLKHCSVYTLILEEGSQLAKRAAVAGRHALPGDDEALEEFGRLREKLEDAGLRRYEISSFAVPGYECKHNMAVWKGEDYLGVGEGAVSGLNRDEKEQILRLRTYLGLDASKHEEWWEKLDFFVGQGLLECGAAVAERHALPGDGHVEGERGRIYYLTKRGAEVCDSILAEII